PRRGGRVILLWGAPGDAPLVAVRAELEHRRADFALLDQREVLDHRVELIFGLRAGIGGGVSSGDRRFAFDEVSALYTRVYDARRMKAVADAGPSGATHVREVESAIWTWADETASLVINRPTAMSSNCSKPYQAAMI